jgi:DNA-binding transcriptional LysR family regulator
MWSLVPEFVGGYSSVFPDVDIRLTDATPLEVLDLTSHRVADVGFICSADTTSLAEQYAAQLHFVNCGELPLVAVMPRDDDLPDPLPLSAFHGRVLIVPRRNLSASNLAEIVEDALAVEGVVPRAKRTVDNIPICLPLVAANFGAAILPDLGQYALGHPGVTVRRLGAPLRPLQVAATWHRTGSKAPVVARMQEFIEARGLRAPATHAP